MSLASTTEENDVKSLFQTSTENYWTGYSDTVENFFTSCSGLLS